MLVLILIIKKLIPNIQNDNIAIISTNLSNSLPFKGNSSFCYINKKYIISSQKEAKLETNLKSVIPEKYYNFFNVFSKKNLKTLLLHQKYDYKIYLKKD